MSNSFVDTELEPDRAKRGTCWRARIFPDVRGQSKRAAWDLSRADNGGEQGQTRRKRGYTRGATSRGKKDHGPKGRCRATRCRDQDCWDEVGPTRKSGGGERRAVWVRARPRQGRGSTGQRILAHVEATDEESGNHAFVYQGAASRAARKLDGRGSHIRRSPAEIRRKWVGNGPRSERRPGALIFSDLDH